MHTHTRAPMHTNNCMLACAHTRIHGRARGIYRRRCVGGQAPFCVRRLRAGGVMELCAARAPACVHAPRPGGGGAAPAQPGWRSGGLGAGAACLLPGASPAAGGHSGPRVGGWACVCWFVPVLYLRMHTYMHTHMHTQTHTTNAHLKLGQTVFGSFISRCLKQRSWAQAISPPGSCEQVVGFIGATTEVAGASQPCCMSKRLKSSSVCGCLL